MNKANYMVRLNQEQECVEQQMDRIQELQSIQVELAGRVRDKCQLIS